MRRLLEGLLLWVVLLIFELNSEIGMQRMRLVRHKPDDGADDLLPIAANFEAFALAAHGLALVAHKDRILPVSAPVASVVRANHR